MNELKYSPGRKARMRAMYKENPNCRICLDTYPDMPFDICPTRKLAAYEDTGLSPTEVAELAQAKADGRVVVLPCKIGEKVYRYCNDAINEGTITNILLNVKTGEIGLEYEMPTCYTCSRSGTLGKNLFLTREEAEKALKERENND